MKSYLVFLLAAICTIGISNDISAQKVQKSPVKTFKRGLLGAIGYRHLLYLCGSYKLLCLLL